MRRVAAIVLAAGASTRLGQPKQLARLAGERLLERAVRVATEAGCAPVVVVLGAAYDRILLEWKPGAARVVRNEAWAEGMGASVRLGIASILGEADAAVVMTCDQPATTAQHLRRLMELCSEAPVASAYLGRRGTPACFAASSFDELLLLRGDQGARAWLQSAAAIELVRGELDIDTPESLAAARAIFG